MKDIQTYTYQDFVSRNKPHDTPDLDGCSVFTRELSAGYISEINIEGYIALLCLSGELKVYKNKQTRYLTEKDLLLNAPTDTLLIHCEKSARVAYIVIAPDHIYKSRQNRIIDLIPMMTVIKQQSIITLSDELYEIFVQQINCICQCSKIMRQSDWYNDTITSGIQMLLYNLLYSLKSNAEGIKISRRLQHNRQEEYFTRFLQLISVHYKKERKVEFYASKLCITPKYLSTIIKQVSGKSASCWIEERVSHEAEYLLTNTNISIKEIAYELNFPSLSFFGTYFKRRTGYSPHTYRTQKLRAMPQY